MADWTLNDYYRKADEFLRWSRRNHLRFSNVRDGFLQWCYRVRVPVGKREALWSYVLHAVKDAKVDPAEEETLDMFAVARESDPDTSHEAAESLSPDALRESQKYVLTMLRELGPLADFELETHIVSFSPSRVRTARAELVAVGAVRDTGRVRPTPSGRNAIVWEVRE